MKDFKYIILAFLAVIGFYGILFLIDIKFSVLFLVIAAFLVSYLLTPIVRRYAQRANILDQPDKCKIHQKPMPRIGGVAIFLGFLIPALFLPSSQIFWALLWGGALITFIGLLDDVLKLPAIIKLSGQILVALWAIYFGVRVEVLSHLFNSFISLGSLAVPLTFFWILAIINAINLIDGLDGLATGISAISFFVLAIIAGISGNPEIIPFALILGASSFGFLRYNFNPATIFMGDSGSMFLGYSLAILSITGTVKVAALFTLIIPILLLALPIFDMAATIIRRVQHKQSVFLGDKMHIHHRLLDLGFSHRGTVLLIYLITLVLGGLAIYASMRPFVGILLLGLSILIFLMLAFKIGLLSFKIRD